MKKKITFTTLMVFLIATVYCQNFKLKAFGNPGNSGIEQPSERCIRYGMPDISPGKNWQLFLPGTLLKSAGSADQMLDSIIQTNENEKYKTAFIYGLNGVQTANRYHWDKTNKDWIKSLEIDYTFDQTGKISKVVYHGLSNPYFGESELSCFYNAGGKLKETVFVSTSGTFHTVYTYDNKGILTQTTEYWENKETHTSYYGYDANGNLTGIYCSPDLLCYQEKYVYNPQGKINQLCYQGVDLGGEYRDTIYFDYDSYGNLVQESTYQWKNNLREIYQKVEYNYDKSSSYSELIFPRDVFISTLSSINPFYNPNLNSRNYYHKLTGYRTFTNGKTGDEVTFFYSSHVKSFIPEILTEVISIYPNPVSGKLYFNFPGSSNHAMFQLFDTRGSKVMEREISPAGYVDMEGLKQGIYLYNIVTENSSQGGKLTKN